MKKPGKLDAGNVSFRKINRAVNDLADVVLSLWPSKSPTVHPKHTSVGTSWEAIPGSRSESSSTVKLVQVIGFYGDYLACLEPSTNLTFYAVAPWPLRTSSQPAQVYGSITAITVLSPSERRVTGTIGGVPVTEIQNIVPTYGLGEQMILIENVGNEACGGLRTDPNLVHGDNAIVWTDRNEAARAWAAIAVINGA